VGAASIYLQLCDRQACASRRRSNGGAGRAGRQVGESNGVAVFCPATFFRRLPGGATRDGAFDPSGAPSSDMARGEAATRRRAML